MRFTSRIVLMLGGLIVSAGLAEAGDRTASQFYVGDTTTVGQPTPASLGKRVPDKLVPQQPNAALAPPPVAKPPARQDRDKTVVLGQGSRSAGTRLRLAAAGKHRPVPTRADTPKTELAHADLPLAIDARDRKPAVAPKAADPTLAPSANLPPAATNLNDRARTPGESHAVAQAAAAATAPAVAAAAAVKVASDGPRERAAPTLADLVAKHAQENGVPLRLANAVVTIESRGNSHAANRGALGLMQIKPDTARSVGFNGGAAGLFEPEINLRYGMKILGQAFKASGGDLCKALVRYQSGHAVTRMNASNRAYCLRARAVMAGA